MKSSSYFYYQSSFCKLLKLVAPLFNFFVRCSLKIDQLKFINRIQQFKDNDAPKFTVDLSAAK